MAKITILAKSIGRRLKSARLYIKQAKVADNAGIKVAQYSRYERGEAVPSENIMAKLSEALNVDVRWLAGAVDTAGGYDVHLAKMEILGKAIGRRIKTLRGKRSITDVVEKTWPAPRIEPCDEIDEKLYKKYEEGSVLPTDPHLRMLAQALDCDPQELVSIDSMALSESTADDSNASLASLYESLSMSMEREKKLFEENHSLKKEIKKLKQALQTK